MFGKQTVGAVVVVVGAGFWLYLISGTTLAGLRCVKDGRVICFGKVEFGSAEYVRIRRRMTGLRTDALLHSS